MSLVSVLKIFSLFSFYGYGISCLYSQKMRIEFDRYGLSKFRALTGALQVAGSSGLLLGFFYEPLTIISSLGLMLLMFLGVMVRLKIRDPIYAAFPALFFMIINLMIFLISANFLADIQIKL